MVILGVATSFTMGASASFLKPAQDEGTVTSPGALAPLSPLTPPAATALVTFGPQPPDPPTSFAVTDVGNRPPPHAPLDLDTTDPWSPARTTIAAPRARKAKPRPLDTEDPWATNVGERALPTFAPVRIDAADPWAKPALDPTP